MKMNEIMKSVNGVANKVCFKVQKHSPEILVIGGLIGLGASFVMACKASTKLNPTLEEAAQKSEAIKAAAEKMGAEPVKHGDAGYEFTFLDNYRLRLIVWEGDEEFPPNAQLLYTANFVDGFAAEDRVVAGDILISTIKAAF